MEDDSDMAYGKVKHTWFQRQAFNEAQKDDEDEEEEETEFSKRKKFLMSFDFSDAFNYRYVRYRKLDKMSVLGAIYKKSLFVENNIRFNEEQTYFADALVVTSIFKYAKNIKSNEDCLYAKRHHNDKQNNPAISQHTR